MRHKERVILPVRQFVRLWFPFIALVITLSLSSPVHVSAQDTPQKPRITVLPFEAIEVSESVAQSVTALFETNLVNTKAYTVVSQSDRDQVLQAQEAALAGCEGEDCAIQIGKLLSAQQIVLGDVAALGKKLIINAKIIDINTAQILGADTTSAQSIEELEEASARLSQSLVASALPGVQLAEAGAEAKAAAAAAAEKPAVPEGEGQPEGAAKIEKKPGKAVTTAATGRGKVNSLALTLMSGGLLLLEAGSAAGSMSYEFLQQSVSSYERYLGGAGDWDTLYAEYQADYRGQATFGISSYSLWALGASAMSTSVFLFPEETFQLSTFGKISYTSGLALTLLGNAFGLMAGNQAVKNRSLFEAYLSATGDWDVLYQQYQAGYTAYSLMRILSYSFWGLGGLGMAGSFLLPGEKAPIITGPLDRILWAGGTVLLAGGSLLQSMALSTLQSAAAKYEKYLSATGDFDTLYADYQAARARYVLFSVLSYGLWTAGGAAILTSVFLPTGGTRSVRPREKRPAVLSLIPSPSGFTIQIAYHAKGMNQ